MSRRDEQQLLQEQEQQQREQQERTSGPDTHTGTHTHKNQVDAGQRSAALGGDGDEAGTYRGIGSRLPRRRHPCVRRRLQQQQRRWSWLWRCARERGRARAARRPGPASRWRAAPSRSGAAPRPRAVLACPHAHAPVLEPASRCEHRHPRCARLSLRALRGSRCSSSNAARAAASKGRTNAHACRCIFRAVSLHSRSRRGRSNRRSGRSDSGNSDQKQGPSIGQGKREKWGIELLPSSLLSLRCCASRAHAHARTRTRTRARP